MKFTRCSLRGRSTRFTLNCLIQWGLRIVCLASLAVFASSTSAAPPPNDTCSGAEVIPGTGPFPYASSIIADVTDATTTGETVEPSCLSYVSRSIWFVFTPAQTAFYRFSVHGDTATTVRDTVMAVYTSSGGCGGPFTEVACNDDSGLALEHCLQSAIATNLQAATTYYIVVWVLGDFPPDPGATAVQLRVSKPQIPANDTCAGAEIIPNNGPFPYLTAVTDTLRATQYLSEPIPSCRVGTNSERSVWYRFTPEQSAFFSISTRGGPGGTATTIYDTILAMYTSTNGCNGPFVGFACNDHINPKGELRSEIRTNLTAGQTYYIVVYDTEEYAAVAETEVQLQVTIPPEAFTLPASSITSTGAVLNGLVRLNGLRTFYWFEWGTNTAYELPRSSVKLLFTPPAEASVNATFSGLLSNTLYHYRLVATNSNGRAEGEDSTFMWSTSRPNLVNCTIPVSGGIFQFQFNGAPGQLYQVQSSTNLRNWVDAGSATDLGSGLFQFIDRTPPGVPLRFYRIWTP
jgi:hypothetical protein